MVDDRSAPPALRRLSLSLILYSNDAAPAVLQALREAEQTLQAVALDYEVLVISVRGATELEETVRQEMAVSARIRLIVSEAIPTYWRAMQIALAASTAPLIAVSDGSVDMTALNYLVPLAQQHEVVFGHRQDSVDSLVERSLSRLGNFAARAWLGTSLRDGGGGARLSLFHRSALAAIVPAGDDPFVPAALLAQARGLGLTMAEAPVSARKGAVVKSPCDQPSVWARVTAAIAFGWDFQFGGKPALSSRRAVWGLAFVLAVVAGFLLFPNNQPLLEPDEARQAEVPRQMLVHDDLLVPRIRAIPYYEKPPLQYWLTAGLYSTLGVHPWVARLVPATSAWLTVLCVYAWGVGSLGARHAFIGSVALCLTLGFVALGRTVILDSLLVLCIVSSWLAGNRALSHGVVRWPWWFAAALACGVGFLVKGPVALVLVLPPLVAFRVCHAGAARPKAWAWAAFLAVAIAVPAPWYIAMAVRDPAYLEQFFWKANVLRFLNPYDHQQPWWFYAPVLFFGMFPWSLLFPAVACLLFSRRAALAGLRTPGLGFCLLAASWCLLFFSASGCKSPPYVAPAFAPLSLMAGVCLDAVIFRSITGQHRVLAFAQRALPRRAAIALFITAAVAYILAYSLGWQSLARMLAMVLLALGLAAACWRYGQRLRPLAAWGMCTTVTTMFILFPLRDVSAGYAAQHSPLTLARMIRRWPGSHNSVLLSFQREWQSASFYLQRQVLCFYGEHLTPEIQEQLLQKPEVLVFVENGDNLNLLLSELPSSMDREVIVPDPDGSVALVVVRAAGHRAVTP
jgi:dolichol-phosphate mannosyltransferase